MTLTKNFKELGFNDKEITIYLALLKHGRMSPAHLSQMTKINRATVYSTAKTLHSKGLIAEDFSGKSRYLAPLSPKQLSQLIERPRRELLEKEIIVQNTIEELGQLTAEHEYPVPKVRFIQEGDLEDFLFEHTQKWQRSILEKDGIWWGFQDHSFAEQYEKWIHWAWRTKEGRDPRQQARVITNATTIEKKLRTRYPREKRDMRLLPRENFTSTVWVAGDFVITIATQHHPFYLVEIQDALLAHNMREMFKKIWEQTEKFS